MIIILKVEEAHRIGPDEGDWSEEARIHLEPQGYDDDSVVGLEVGGKTWIIKREDLARVVNTF